jgi:hypothetical protein
MKRTLFIVAALVGFAAAASAAPSLVVTANATTYTVGATITLTVTGDDDGVTDNGIFGKLDYDGSKVDNGTRAQTQLGGSSGKWTTGGLNASDSNAVGPNTASSYAFSQISLSYNTATNLPGTLSTVTLIAKAVGTVNVQWDSTNPNPSLVLDFFGLTNAPGTTFTIIPEPTTVALLGLGLMGLVLGGRRRS